MELTEKSYYVYMHCLPDGTPFYIGRATDDKNRRAWTSKNRSPLWHEVVDSLKSQGQEYLVIVMPCDSKEESLDKEMLLIAGFGKRRDGGLLVNIFDGGEDCGGNNKPHTEEAKAKMSASHMGVPLSEETRRKMSESQTGRSHSAETIAKLRQARKGVLLSEEEKAVKRDRRFLYQMLREEGLLPAFDGSTDPADIIASDEALQSRAEAVMAEIRFIQSLRELGGEKRFPVGVLRERLQCSRSGSALREAREKGIL